MVIEACRKTEVFMPVAPADLGWVLFAWRDADIARFTAASIRQDAMSSAMSTTSEPTGQRFALDIFQASAQHFGQGTFQAFVASARNRR